MTYLWPLPEAEVLDDRVRETCDVLYLTDYLSYFRAHNRSELAPYHNNYHTFCMVLNCYEGALAEKLDLEDSQAVVLGALFHDFNHSAGHQPDDVNVRVAIQGLEQAWQEVSSNQVSFPTVTHAGKVIAITKYPYDRDPVTTTEKIIRDADLMQPYDGDELGLLKQYLGLKAEIEVQRRTVYSPAAFGEGMKEFLDGVTWHTEWARQKAIRFNWEEKKLALKHLLCGVR